MALGYLWVARAGIALLALGLAFLYRFAVQRGLITPPMRVAFGLLLGTVSGDRLRRGAAGLVLAGLWAADVSTASALLLGSATLVCHDLVKRFWAPHLALARA